MRNSSIKIINLNKVCLIVIYVLLSTGNLVVIYGYNPVSSLIIGQLIVTFVVLDFARSPYHFHVYQVINYYFYYSLVVSHSFNSLILNDENYVYAYMINFFHFVFFSLGYNFIKYDYTPVRITPKQNYIYLIYVVAGIILSIIAFSVQVNGLSYSDKFGSFESTRNLPIYRMTINAIIGYYKGLFIFLMNNPFLMSIFNLITSGFGYVGSGIKAGVLISGITVILSYQFFVKKIKLTQLIYLIPISVMLLAILIGSTSFRGNLGLDGFMLLNVQSMVNFLKYFLVSPESNHILYTSNVISLIDSDQTSFRFGFDYWRIFLYPIKHLFLEFEFASYNQFVHLMTGKQVNAGLYLGLAGELFWNFGYFFFIFSFITGILLKKYTNWAFSGYLFGMITYLILLQPVMWHLYRGSANALMMSLIFFIPGYILFKISFKVIMNAKYTFIRKYFIRFRESYK
jgi:hypothetical protein